MTPTPPGRTSEAKGRALVAARSGLLCEVCGRRQATNVHHRRGRQIFDQWRPSNLLHLCGTGSTLCHGAITEHRMDVYGPGFMVRRNGRHEPEQVPAYIWHNGGPSWCWLHNNGDVTSIEQGEIYEWAEGS